MIDMTLEKILNINKWQNLQDSLADITNMALLTVNYKGIPITRHSCCCDFCKEVRKDPELSKRCQKCDSRGGFEAVCSGKPYIYLCHYGIVDIAIPISINEKYIGAVMAGQIKISNIDSSIKIEKILSSQTGLSALENSPRLQELYQQIPVLDYKRVCSISNMLFHLCNYIAEEAQTKNYLLEMYDTILQVESDRVLRNTSHQEIDQIKASLSSAISDVYIQPPSDLSKPSQNPLLNQVMDYIQTHRNQMLSLTEAADLIHLSPSYFSRLFSKEYGRSYTSYVNSLKIEWAKQLLEKTNLSVTQISDELGFTDSGYFIKTFKKEEHVTPLAYRNVISK